MGAAASIPESEYNSFKEWHQVVTDRLRDYKTRKKLPDNDDVILNNALSDLSKLCDREEYRALLTEASIDLPHQLLSIIQTHLPLQKSQNNCEIVAFAIVCLWYLSRSDDNRKLFGREDYGLVQIIAPLIIRQDPSHAHYQHFLFSVVINIMNASSVLPYMLSDEVGLLKFYVQRCNDYPEDLITFRMLGNIAGAAKSPADFQRLVDSKSYIPIIKRLKAIDVNANWSNGGIEYWCLNFALQFARHPEASKLYRELGVLSFFLDLLKTQSNTMEGLKAACLLAFVLGKEESVESSKSLLQQYPMVLDLLILVFGATLKQNQGPEAESLRSKEFVYGILALENITGALLRLSISDANKASMIECDVISSLLLTLKLFVDNAPELRYMDSYNLFGGGGGEDVISAEYALDCLLQLSFYFQTDDELRRHYLQPKFGSLVPLLKACFEHPLLSAEMKQNISSLLRKLEFSKREETQETKSIDVPQTRKHVMISYSWAANKPYVVAFANTLRQLGYDVWRDEEGSSIVGPMSGDTDMVMADAIQHAQAVIICVSPQYKESINCRSEAKYCKARQFQSKDLELIYVMMSENYHTRSEPFCVDGWLGFMIGTELWYPLWNEAVVSSAAQGVAKILGPRAKLGTNAMLIPQAAGVAMSMPVQREKNVQDAWDCIQGKNKSKYPQTTTTFLEELGVEKAADLQELDEEQVDLLAMLLKPVPKKQFLVAMARL